MSTTSSSDSGPGYSNFQKYKKKHLIKRKATKPIKTSPKKKEAPVRKKIYDVESSEESSDAEMTVEQIIEAQKKKKPVKKEVELDLDLSLDVENEEEEAGPSTRSQEKKGKKKGAGNLPPVPKRAQALLEEYRNMEHQQKMEEKAHLNAVEYIANQVHSPVVDPDAKNNVTVLLSLLNDPTFNHIIKMKRTERFDKIFLDYGALAGYDKPEDLTLIWDSEEAYKNIKYFDTPEKLEMPSKGTVKLILNPKEGAVRDKREEGEIKIKLNLKKQKAPLERLIHKEMPFGEFKIKICTELQLFPSKVRFTFDGDRISDDSTPLDLDMDEYDIVDMIVED